MNINLKSIESIEFISPEKIMKEIAADMEDKVQLRFRRTKEPDGKKWKPLSQVTVARRRGKSRKPLNDNGKLKGSINSKYTKRYAVVGTNYKPAPTHQFGAKKGEYKKYRTKKNRKLKNVPWGDIPARPFLGFSNRQAKSYLKKIVDYNRGKKIVITFK